jgi:hypothetical protein
VAIAVAAGGLVFPAYAAPCQGYTAETGVEELITEVVTLDRFRGSFLERNCSLEGSVPKRGHAMEITVGRLIQP